MKKFTLCAFADEAGPTVPEQISALCDNGIKYIELRGVDSRNFTTLTKTEMRELASTLSDSGISVWSMGSPIGKVSMDKDFGKYLELYRHTLELSNIVGAKNMRMFSFFMDAKDADKNEAEVIDRLGTLAEIAKQFDVVLCHENEKGIFGDTHERCLKIHKAIPEIRAVFDPANFVQCGCNTIDAWNTLSDHVYYMHIKDVAANGEIVPAGKGVGNIPYLLERFSGEVLTLEPHLTEFVGLASLENGEETSMIGTRYATGREAFDHAVASLKEILEG